MSHRRFHTKSRHGCVQCKQSRKKCDENRPRCGRCERAKQPCSLSGMSSNLMFISTDPASDRHRKSADISNSQPDSHYSPQSSALISLRPGIDTSPAETSASPSFTPASDSSTLVDSLFTDTERERLRLMHHYTLHTAESLAILSIPSDRDQTIWHTFAVDLALENDLMLHGLLSLSALHLALKGVSKQRHTILAIHHHDLGLAIFRPCLANIAAQNYESIFGFTCIVMLYAFGIQRCSESTANTIEKVHQILTLISMSKPITKSHMEALRRSRWSVMMMPEPYPTIDEKLPEEIETMLLKLVQRASMIATIPSQLETYTAAIRSLRYILIATSTPRPAHVTLVLFPMMIPAEYWDLILNHDPLALAIVANYAVLLHRLRFSIWLEGWGREMVDAVRAILASEWHDCVEWAVNQTRFV